MVLPVAVITSIASALLKGPLAAILDTYIKDAESRRRLEAELETSLVAHLGKAMELEQAIVLAEARSEHWLTRSWRPILMLTLLGLLLLVGVVLPFADLIAGHTLPFNPRWDALPPPFWDFLSVGIGGYIGGRTAEKIVKQVSSGKVLKK